MIEFPLGYREVVPDQTQPENWKEIILNTGKKNLHNLVLVITVIYLYYKHFFFANYL